jgi:hypothetical protein
MFWGGLRPSAKIIGGRGRLSQSWIEEELIARHGIVTGIPIGDVEWGSTTAPGCLHHDVKSR